MRVASGRNRARSTPTCDARPGANMAAAPASRIPMPATSAVTFNAAPAWTVASPPACSRGVNTATATETTKRPSSAASCVS